MKNRIIERLKQEYRKSRPVAYAITFKNRFSNESGIYIFANKADAEYLYRLSDKILAETRSMGNAQGNIPEHKLDNFDYGLIRINQLIQKTLCKVSQYDQFMTISGNDYNIQRIGNKPIITYIKD